MKILAWPQASALAAMLHLGATVAAAQSPPEEARPADSDARVRLEPERNPLAITFQARFGGIAGEFDADRSLKFDDLFEEGFGFALEASYDLSGGDLLVCPWLAIGWETYEGKDTSDDLGDSWEPDRLDIVSVLAGLKVSFWHREFPGDEKVDVCLYAGAGAVHYGSVGGSSTVAGVSSSEDLIEATTAFAFMIGGGVRDQIGSLVIDVDFGFRFQGPPEGNELDFGDSLAVVLLVKFGLGLHF